MVRDMVHGCLLLLASVVWSPGYAQDDEVFDCDSLENHFGPWDYRLSLGTDKLRTVERFHFTPTVELLRSGQSGFIGGDITYTLEVFPNHHRALLSMAKLALREKTKKPEHSRFTMACWFDRARRMAPDDPAVRAIQGFYYSKLGQKKEALQFFTEAIELGDTSANTVYNLALVQLDLGDYDNALLNARKAYGLGAQLPGLRQRLMKAGKWRD